MGHDEGQELFDTKNVPLTQLKQVEVVFWQVAQLAVQGVHTEGLLRTI